LWCLLGYPDQALQRISQALTLAQDLSHPYSLGFALNRAARLHQYRREGQWAFERAEAGVTLCTEQGFTYLAAMGTVSHGWALAWQGQGEEGIRQIGQGLAVFRATGAVLHQVYVLALLAEAYQRAGQIQAGLDAVAEALAGVERTEERWYEAELHRLKGELVLQHDLSDAP
jgi:predicted ATPase